MEKELTFMTPSFLRPTNHDLAEIILIFKTLVFTVLFASVAPKEATNLWLYP